MRLKVSDIEIEVIRKDIKNMHLRVLPPNGDVVVSAPERVSDGAIEGFVAAKLSWIRKQRRALCEQPRQTRREGVSGETMYVWGQQFYVTVVPAAHYDLRLGGTEATFEVPASSSAENRVSWLREWYRGQLENELDRLVPIWESRTGLKCVEWRTKYMKTQWGSCNPEAGRLWFNVQLAKHPVECLEYIVLHELAHLREKSHNDEFKAILDMYMPTWRSVRKKLNAQTLDFIG